MEMKMIVSGLVILSFVFNCVGLNDTVVTIPQGQIRGTKENHVIAFYGIPYATAPTGPQKFKAPLPPPKWKNTFDAVEKGIICPQADTPLSINKTVKEDCLVANIFAPTTNATDLPVVVYIHGGGFQMGFGTLLRVDQLVKSQRVVAVNFNYRLGAYGFLCLGTKDIPGNAGMRDIIALLRWVKTTILAFGGNPNDITLAGSSSGSALVDLLVLSKASTGLFNKAILESGSAITVGAVQIGPLEIAQNFAYKSGFHTSNDTKALEKFYMTASFKTLYTDTFYDRPNSTFGFTPCVERSTGNDMIIEEAPFDTLKKMQYKKIPMLYGFSNMEGLFRVDKASTWLQRMNENFSEFLPGDLHFKSDVDQKEVVKSARNLYFGDKNITEDTIHGYINYFGDVLFEYPALRTVRLQVEAGNDKMFLYEFLFPMEHKTPTGRVLYGGMHRAETIALLDGDDDTRNTTQARDYQQLKTRMREMWLNFVVTGTPTPQGNSSVHWSPVSNAVLRAPFITLNTKITIGTALLQRRSAFWDSIYKRFYRKPDPPDVHHIGEDTVP